MSFSSRAYARLMGFARCLLVSAAAFGLAAGGALPALAAGGQQGNINGTVVDAQTRAPIANATISAAAPTGAYSAHTDARGFFSILGMVVDTYAVSIQAPGYEPQTEQGITVQGDQNISLPVIALAKTLKTIGRVTARSASSVYQPHQTVDAYQVSGERILQTTGKAASTNENNLALAVPGVTMTNSGGVQNLTIRGGLRTEVGYQYDGVDFTEPFFANNASNGFYAGIGSLQIVEGAGDATQGNVGGGVVNLVPKRGTQPAFGMLDLEVGSPNFFHQASFEYGWASNNGRYSDYVAYMGQRWVPYIGYSNANAAAYDNYYAGSYEANNDFVNNFVYKFGKSNSQQLQILYRNRDLQEWGNAGGVVLTGSQPTSFYPVDPYNQVAQQFASLYQGGLANYSRLIGINPGVPSSYNVTGPEEIAWNPTRYLKFEYDNNIDSTTFLSAKYYNWETLQGGSNNLGSTFQNPVSLGLGAYPTWNETGGPKVGGRIDITKQLSAKNTLTLDTLYEVAHPIWNGYDPNALTFLMTLFPLFGVPGPSYADFLPGGYLAKYFPGGVPRIPVSGINYNQALFQNFGVGIREQWQPNDRLRADFGIRYDGQNQKYGVNPFNPSMPGNPSDVNPGSITSKYVNPREWEPRVAVAYQSDPADSFRFGYGRSTVFLVAQTAGTPAAMFNAAAFAKVPPLANFQCGSLVPGAPPVKCQNYAQQLYWLYDQNFDAPDLGGALPAEYNNYDFTYQHQFQNGWGLRVTPFYKLGTNLPSFALLTGLAAGAAVFTVNNQGINRTTGLEFGMTTPDHPTGLSGFLSMTYQNVLASSPPLIGGEDALPINGSGSLELNDVYRAGYVSPFSLRIGGDYKTKNGWRVNPILQYDRGYPYNAGNITASSAPFLNGAFANIPQVNFGPGVTQIPGYQSSSGTTNSTNYFDPANPGNALHPNIAWSRGTPGTPSSGGALWKPNLNAQLTVEYSYHKNTFGILMQNLFGNAYNNQVPFINPYYQPVANGIAGPQTGNNAFYNPSRGFANVPKDSYAFSNGAYLLLPNQPMTFQFYFQRSL